MASCNRVGPRPRERVRVGWLVGRASYNSAVGGAGRTLGGKGRSLPERSGKDGRRKGVWLGVAERRIIAITESLGKWVVVYLQLSELGWEKVR